MNQAGTSSGNCVQVECCSHNTCPPTGRYGLLLPVPQSSFCAASAHPISAGSVKHWQQQPLTRKVSRRYTGSSNTGFDPRAAAVICRNYYYIEIDSDLGSFEKKLERLLSHFSHFSNIGGDRCSPILSRDRRSCSSCEHSPAQHGLLRWAALLGGDKAP